MPAFNVERYIGEAIESVLHQSFRDFEFMILDDGSSDATPDIIKSFAERDQRIIFHTNSQTCSLPETLNRGISLARGTLIARMDADDIIPPQRFQKQVEFLRDHPDVGIVGGSMVIVDEDNVPIGTRRYWQKDADIRKHLFRYSPFCGASIMVRKHVFDATGGYNVHFTLAEDYEFFLRAGTITRFANLDEVVYRYRLRPHSLTADRMRDVERATIRIRKQYFKVYGASLMDRLYNVLHAVSLYLLPFSWKCRFFLVIREKIL